MKRRILLALTCLLGAISLVILYLNLYQEDFILKARPLPQNHKFVFEGNYEEKFIQVGEDARINGLHFKVKKPKGAVIYLHGRSGNLGTFWGYLAGDFTHRNHDVFIFDYRTFGKSTGVPSEAGLISDAEAAYEYMLQHYDEKEIIVYGISLGTGFATYLAHKYNPKMLILEAPYYSMKDLVPYNMPLIPDLMVPLVLRYPLRTDLWIQEVKCPIHIFHGTEDDLIPYHCSKRLYKLVKDQASLVTIEKGTHNFLSKHPEYQQHLTKILAE